MTRKTNTQLAAEAKLKHDKYTRKAKETAVANDPRWKVAYAALLALRRLQAAKVPEVESAKADIDSAIDGIELACALIAGIE